MEFLEGHCRCLPAASSMDFAARAAMILRKGGATLQPQGQGYVVITVVFSNLVKT